MVSTTRNLPAYFSHFDAREFEPFDSIVIKALDQLFPEYRKLTGGPFGNATYPKVNVIEFDNRVEIEAEVAGLTKEDINIEVADGILSISGEKAKKDGAPENDSRFLIHELKRSWFKRSFVLGDAFDEENITASFDNGILTIVMSKKEPEKPKTRKVEIG